MVLALGQGSWSRGSTIHPLEDESTMNYVPHRKALHPYFALCAF